MGWRTDEDMNPETTEARRARRNRLARERRAAAGPGKRTIRQNRYDNWYGYLGGRRVRAFGASTTETPAQMAARWQAGDDTAGIASSTRRCPATHGGLRCQLAAGHGSGDWHEHGVVSWQGEAPAAAGSSRDGERWRQLARRWAEARWCWDDCDEDINRRADLQHDRPDEFIDRMAEHWDLTDPTEGWGVRAGVNEQRRRETLKAAIDDFMARRQG